MTKARERKTAITIIVPVLDYTELMVRNHGETFRGGAQATAVGLSVPHLPPIPTPGITIISLYSSACHAPLFGLSSGPIPLLPLQLFFPASPPHSHCWPQRLLLILKHAVYAPHVGHEMLHHLMTPTLHGDLASPALAWLLWALPAPAGAIHAFLGSQLSWAVSMPEDDAPEN